MDESEWLNATDPQVMLAFLRDTGRTSDRKFRLFACACCHQTPGKWGMKGRSQNAVEMAERYAEGLASEHELDHAKLAGMKAATAAGQKMWRVAAWYACWRVASHAAQEVARVAAGEEGVIVNHPPGLALVRDIFGNPFHAKSVIDPTWLAWNDGTIHRIAEGIYEERAFGRMPVLADALLDAVCDNEEVLQHCREQGSVHARGCWVLDLILSKDR